MLEETLVVRAQTRLRINPPQRTRHFVGHIEQAMRGILPVHAETVLDGRVAVLRPGTVQVTLDFAHWG